jgi:hypothetical protein
MNNTVKLLFVRKMPNLCKHDKTRLGLKSYPLLKLLYGGYVWKMSHTKKSTQLKLIPKIPHMKIIPHLQKTVPAIAIQIDILQQKIEVKTQLNFRFWLSEGFFLYFANNINF